MKLRSAVFVCPLLAAAFLTVLGSAFFRKAPPPAAAIAPEAARYPQKPLPAADSDSLTPAERAARLQRWLDLAASAKGLATADEEIRSLVAADFPRICEEALSLPEAGRTPLLRLLAIRWAEWDGAAALEWARSQFHSPAESDWDFTWLNDLASTWFAARPEDAAAWCSKISASPEQKAAWTTQSRDLPVENWTRPGNVVEIARAKLAGLNPKSRIYSVSSSPAAALGRQITTLNEIEALRGLLVDEWETSSPPRKRLPDGTMSCGVGGSPGLTIAAAFEEAWPRVDPLSWRQYAEEKVIGATGKLLTLEVAREDCRKADDPAAVALAFFQNPRSRADLADPNEMRGLLDAVEERQPGAGWELLRTGAVPYGFTVAVPFVLDKHPGDLPGAMADLETQTDAGVRRKTEETCLLRREWDPSAVESWLQSSGWPADRVASFREMQAAAPISPY